MTKTLGHNMMSYSRSNTLLQMPKPILTGFLDKTSLLTNRKGSFSSSLAIKDPRSA